MFFFESAFSRKRCIFASEDGTACGDRPLSDSRARLPEQLRVPWVRVDHNKISEHVKKSIFATKHRISELCNTTILALEKISTGYLGVWEGRRYRRSDTIEIDELENPNALKSVRSRDLLLRVEAFWRDFDRRFRKAGWGESVAAIDYTRLPAKFSSQYFSLGGSAPGQGLSRGDVVSAKLEWIDLPVAENPIPLENLSPRLKQLLSNREQYMSVEPSPRKTIGTVRSYEDPLFRSKRGKLGLAKLLYRANMLRVVSRLRGPAVKCLTVLEKR